MPSLAPRQLQFVGAVGALALLTPCVVHAHGPPPQALSVLVADADGPVVVKLVQGLARRQGGGRFQFICPALWGDQQVTAVAPPTAALADGTLVVGANSGLMLLASDGSIRPHPDPNAVGISTEIARSEAGVFSLRLANGRSEVLAIDAQSVKSLWSDSGSWYSLAALPKALVLVRANGTSVEQLSLSLEGVAGDHQQASVSSPVDYVFARGAGNDPYALLLFQTAPVLGRIANGAFSSFAEGLSSVVGPLPEGNRLLLAVDGQLSTLHPDGGVAPLTDSTYVTCLDQSAGQSFACTRDGVAQLADAGLGARVFLLSSLVAPDSAAISDDAVRARCDYQWQDLRFDLIAIGMSLTYDTGPADAGLDAAVDAGVDAQASGLPLADAEAIIGVDAEAAPQTLDAGAEMHAKGASCALGRVRAPGPLAWLFVLGLVLRRRRRG